MVSIDRVADLASITNQHELENDEEFLKGLNQNKEEYAYWEQQIDAVLNLLIKKGLMNVHMLRKGVESIDKTVYNKLSYYERWAISITKHVLETHLLTQDDLNKKYGPPLYSTNEQLFHVGDYVRVQHENYATRWVKPHLRTPGYVYGKVGFIERYCGIYPNPEYYAYDNSQNMDHTQPLYRVRFNQKDLWNDYGGSVDDTLDVEIYQSWLTSASKSDRESIDVETNECEHAHDVSHQHDDHVHEKRSIIEQNAIDREGAPLPAQHLAESLISALIDKNIITAKELNQQIEDIEMSGIEQRGAQIVAEAWLDPDFKEKLLKNPTNTITDFLKIERMNYHIVVVENTDTIHNLVVCTLCSCYPRQLLGIPPRWYKSRTYRVRAARDPRSILKQFGTELPETMKIQVHDSTADMRYLVLPRRPRHTENWSREQLIQIVTRASIVGVTDISMN